VTLGSDAFIPFRDNVDRAHASGVEYIVQPGGALRDPDIIQACDDYGMAMAFTGFRLFHH
jgi:phosphoribosylaminoimidazolecarboxamide formyltransferase/IMP cyclohydrolase